MSAERVRLEEAQPRTRHWRRWGPYLSERAWGTVREDYSANGDPSNYLTHDLARSKAYRWGEDGIAGLSDNHQRICFAIALWNGRDPILKERLFGLAGPEGSHGEDVKECYYYLDATPTHSHLKHLYKYPQQAFPYGGLAAGGRRPKWQSEMELAETGVFADNRYFDVVTEYAKASDNDIYIRVTVRNAGPAPARLHLLPTVWFRNVWSWNETRKRPFLQQSGAGVISLWEPSLCRYTLWMDTPDQLLFTENDTNTERLYGYSSSRRFYKDAFHRYVIEGDQQAVNPADTGTKAAGWFLLQLAPGETRSVRLRLTDTVGYPRPSDFDEVLATWTREADEFYASFVNPALTADARSVQRQAFAGLVWTKQYYHYVIDTWIEGDSAFPPPPASRRSGRNHDWPHLFNHDIISMPDKWEYPWYAAWDVAFHMIPFALIDPEFAKRQMALFLREWYMHPNGQIPAYEWNFSDVNPPVHAWGCWRVFQIDRKIQGRPDLAFLESVFHKLLMNFTWWVNRKDAMGNNVFEGGFLGLDNIGLFDRSKPLPTGGVLEQSDGTAWMAMYCLNMLRIALELATHNRTYEDIASKFFEHFLYIADAMNASGDDGLWDETDGCYYDRIQLPGGQKIPLKIRSMVRLIPLFAVETIEQPHLESLSGFRSRVQWFLDNRPDLCGNTASMTRAGMNDRRLMSLVGRDRLRRLLARMLDETEFLSPYGIRSLSRFHERNPFGLGVNGNEYKIYYEPAESQTGMFGGNSNWRGPVWFPVNYLIIESLRKYGYYHGDAIQVEYPSGSGRFLRLDMVAAELSRRLSRLFLKDADGRRPIYSGSPVFQQDPGFRDHILFYEYFHGNTGAGLGAMHQTGWTALVAKLLQQSGE